MYEKMNEWMNEFVYGGKIRTFKYSKSSNSQLPFLSGLHLFRLLSDFLTNSFQF